MAIITGLSRDPYTTLFDVFDGVWLSKKAVLWTSVGVLEHPNIPIGTFPFDSAAMGRSLARSIRMPQRPQMRRPALAHMVTVALY